MSRRFWFAFLMVCGAGVFSFFARGMQWGTANCGFLAGLTLSLALSLGFAVAHDEGVTK